MKDAFKARYGDGSGEAYLRERSQSFRRGGIEGMKTVLYYREKANWWQRLLGREREWSWVIGGEKIDLLGMEPGKEYETRVMTMGVRNMGWASAPVPAPTHVAERDEDNRIVSERALA